MKKKEENRKNPGIVSMVTDYANVPQKWKI